jgi:DNA-binding transcriptional MerR regulator/methylmalonyl-CoA mutase cobalamin-binding subunit
MESQRKFPIRVVSQKTGLNVHVLRIWERRYGAVSPARTPTKRRIYSQADVDRFRLLRRAVAAGHSIGQIARLADEQLREILSELESHPLAHVDMVNATNNVDKEETRARTHLEACLHEIQHVNSWGLEGALARATVVLTQPALIDRVLVPLLDQIGRLWCTGELRIVHEHLATTLVRNFLGGLKNSHHLPAGAPCILVTTPVGQLHELGALMAAVTAGAQGWHVTYLGPGLPAEEIAAGAIQTDARAVALSIIYPANDPQLEPELRKLRRLLGNGVEVIVGGRAADHYSSVLAEIGATRVDSIATFRSNLEAFQLGRAS